MTAELQGIGPYRLLELLEERQQVAVYRAVPDDEAELGQPVAVEVLHKSLTDDAELVATTERRWAYARGLEKHDAIVTPLASGRADGRPWLARELVDGLRLRELFPAKRRARFPVEQSVELLRGVLTALRLAAGREEPLCHGRLDASEVLVDTAGRICLGGLGLPGDACEDLERLAELARSMTPSWPPELEGWLDRMEQRGYADPGEALEALPPVDEEGSAKARKALGGRVKRALRKRAKAVQEAATEPTRERSPEVPAETGRLEPTPAVLTEAGRVARQAKRVAALCGVALALALLIEIFTLSG